MTEPAPEALEAAKTFLDALPTPYIGGIKYFLASAFDAFHASRMQADVWLTAQAICCPEGCSADSTRWETCAANGIDNMRKATAAIAAMQMKP